VEGMRVEGGWVLCNRRATEARASSAAGGRGCGGGGWYLVHGHPGVDCSALRQCLQLDREESCRAKKAATPVCEQPCRRAVPLRREGVAALCAPSCSRTNFRKSSRGKGKLVWLGAMCDLRRAGRRVDGSVYMPMSCGRIGARNDRPPLQSISLPNLTCKTGRRAARPPLSTAATRSSRRCSGFRGPAGACPPYRRRTPS
jgi:hypothetical protein